MAAGKIRGIGTEGQASVYFIIFIITWLHCVACGTSRPGIEPMFPAVEVRSLNRRTAREVLKARHIIYMHINLI